MKIYQKPSKNSPFSDRQVSICHMSKPSWQLKGARFGPAAEVDFGTVLGRGVEVGT
jgi:hypothetical protein